MRHLRNGGIISILLDEKYAEGVRIPFLGLDALTSLSAAQLALKYDLPMIPAYGIRIDDGNAFRVEFEAPIPHTDSITMTRAFNDSLSARIMDRPRTVVLDVETLGRCLRVGFVRNSVIGPLTSLRLQRRAAFVAALQRGSRFGQGDQFAA